MGRGTTARPTPARPVVQPDFTLVGMGGFGQGTRFVDHRVSTQEFHDMPRGI